MESTGESANYLKFIQQSYSQGWIRHAYCALVVLNSQPIDNIATKWVRQEVVVAAIAAMRKLGRVNRSVKNIEWSVPI